MPRSAVEYATDNITIYRFCDHGCIYCWAWRNKLFVKRILRGRYDPVEEAKKYAKRRGRIIVVSFTSDPYPSFERFNRLTRRVLEALSLTANKIMILTKNPSLAWDLDKDILIGSENMWLGTTIVTIDHPDEPNDLEPKAPPPSSRIKALREAHKQGVRTWLSIEPIIPGRTYPEEIIRKTISFVDYYVLGSFNYTKQLGFRISENDKKAWYLEHIPPALHLLQSYSKPFLVKKELRRYLE